METNGLTLNILHEFGYLYIFAASFFIQSPIKYNETKARCVVKQYKIELLESILWSLCPHYHSCLTSLFSGK